jgi:hypothetical protein
MRIWITVALLGALLAAGCRDAAREGSARDNTSRPAERDSGMNPTKDAGTGGAHAGER